MEILRENVDREAINHQMLTNDCKFVQRNTGEIDIVREYSHVRIFDHYWDRGIEIAKIWHAGGPLNPKFQTPEL